jgi:RNA recognition motif-containing protein
VFCSSSIFKRFVLQVFVGGLDPNASEEDLRQAFSQFGEGLDPLLS